MLHFEAVPEPGPLSPDYVPPPAEPDAEPEWSGPSQDEWERTQYELQQANQYLQSLGQFMQPAGQQQPQEQEIDPLSETFGQDLRALIREEMAPFAQTQQQWMQTEGEQRAEDIIADDISQRGDFMLESSAGKARDLAESLFPQAVARYGNTPQAAEAALSEACAAVREWEQELSKVAVDRHLNQLATLGSARREPGATPAQAVPVTAGPLFSDKGLPLDEMAVVRKYGGRAPS